MDRQTFLGTVVFGYIKKDLENMRDRIRPQPAAIGNINFPLALCVLAYMEYLGSFLLGRYTSFAQSVQEYISKCFTNPSDYPVEILRDIFRNGLAHEYFARGGISRDGGKPAVYKEVEGAVLDAETLVNDFLESLDKFKQELEDDKDLIDQLPIRVVTSTTRSSGASGYPKPISTNTCASTSSSQSGGGQVPPSAITRPYALDER